MRVRVRVRVKVKVGVKVRARVGARVRVRVGVSTDGGGMLAAAVLRSRHKVPLVHVARGVPCVLAATVLLPPCVLAIVLITW